MPQMSPLWWEILFIMFIMSFLIMNVIIYYNKTPLPMQNNLKNFNINQFKWKW